MELRVVEEDSSKNNRRVNPSLTPRSELTDYGKETTLHGLKYVFQTDKHLCEK